MKDQLTEQEKEIFAKVRAFGEAESPAGRQ